MGRGKKLDCKWSKVRDFDWEYEVSIDGCVRSWLRTTGERRVVPRVLRLKKTNKSSHTYTAVRNLLFPVRLWVAESFVPPFTGDRVVHVDGDHSNNAASNLRWEDDEFVELEGEEWRPIDSFYDVSDLGRVRSWKPRAFRHRRPANPALMSPVLQKSTGYLTVTFSWKPVSVHKLVARAFIGEAIEGITVNHKNGIRVDNRLVNLEYLTQRRNAIHGAERRGRGLPTGVYDKGGSYQVVIRYKGRLVHLGTVRDPAIGARLYWKAVDQIERGVFSPKRVKDKVRRIRDRRRRKARWEEAEARS